ncbi:hypothetical protein DM02DRAFT_597973 [Periconia macrospinosa]|uniref:Membrane fusion mating protein FIG1 n=1 Tax=Periconia macrospinosa TaxID=97972 RepID=A0A2V1DGD5_9PLEO|nr:hypothetical protein DM02DRAFT_597973 [Periconia macrospinosa]
MSKLTMNIGFFPAFQFHHFLMLFLTAGVIIVCKSCDPILLAGCSSYSSMTNVYILGLSYTNSTPSNLSPVSRNLSETLNGYKGASQLEVRAGYFGLCIRQRGVVWLCSSDANGLTTQIGSENDPLDLIGAAAKFKDNVIFSGLLFMAVVLAFVSIILLATFPTWRSERDERTGSDVEVKPFPSRPVTHVAIACSLVASILLLVSSLWQHVGSVGAAAMADISYQGNVHTAIGAQAVSMAWASVILVVIPTIGLIVMILSIMALDRLTDDD